MLLLAAPVAKAAHCGGDPGGSGPLKSKADKPARAEERPEYGLAFGSRAPEFKAASDTGVTYDLEQEIKAGPVVLVFYRGGWCPYCSKQLNELKKLYPEIEKRGASLAAISVDRVEKAAETRDKQEIGFPLLSDPDAEIVEKYNLILTLDEATLSKYETYGIDVENASGRTHHQIAVPAVFIIGADGHIKWSYVNKDYKVRADNEEILKVLDALNKR
jgi:peroxiredoxin